MLIRRGTLRHPKFSELVETISARRPRVARIIEGAIWEIERNPKGLGVYIEQVGVWQARLVVPSSPDLLIFYTVAPRFVTMLTIVTSDGSPLS